MFFRSRSKRKYKRSATDTLIGKDSKVEGKIICQTSLRIEGQVEGDVVCEGDVVLGKNAIARSTITARNVVNSGTIHGAIHSEGTLMIADTGQMYGDIKVASLTIASGGIFEGMSMMNHTPEGAADLTITPEIKGKLRKIGGGSSNPQTNEGNAANLAQVKAK